MQLGIGDRSPDPLGKFRGQTALDIQLREQLRVVPLLPFLVGVLR